MKKTLSTLSCTIFLAVAITSCEKDNNTPQQQITVIQASGDIQDDVQSFRDLLGPLNTTTNVTGGRREITWDAVPDSLENKPLPANFFNQTGDGAQASLQKGLTYSSGGSFEVSSTNFKSINNAASNQFAAFSGTKTFANTSAFKWEVGFQKAGTNTSASVQAFGMVFLMLMNPTLHR